jgi:hypothetical protein
MAKSREIELFAYRCDIKLRFNVTAEQKVQNTKRKNEQSAYIQKNSVGVVNGGGGAGGFFV